MAEQLRASWGVTSAVGGAGGVTGVVVGFEKNVDGSFITETDENGGVNGVFLYDWTGTATVDIQVKASVNGPSLGSTITIGNMTGYVKTVQTTESSTAYKKFRMTVERTKNVTSATIVNAGGGGIAGGGTANLGSPVSPVP